MKSLLRLSALAVSLAAGFGGQQEPELRLPSGKSQKEELLKHEHEQTLKDAARLVELAEQLKGELERNERHVLSVQSLRKTEDIEKLAKKIRGRLRRF